jgi:hypothetical protein
MRIDVAFFPGFCVCTYDGVDEDKTKIVGPFIFENGVMRKIMREIESKK